MSDTQSKELVHPATGELLDPLGQQPAEILAEWALHADELQARVKAFREQLDAELRARLEMHDRTAHVYGDYEVALKRSPREAVWDGDELEAELRRLVDDGVLQAGEWTGVIRRETVVSRSDANRILARLSGPARAAVERCRTWRDRGRTRIEVVRSLPLISQAADPPDRVGGSAPSSEADPPAKGQASETAGAAANSTHAAPAPQPREESFEW